MTEFSSENEDETICHWEGVASYYDVKVDGKEAGNAAWTYHDPSSAPDRIKDYVAFYLHKVEVQG